MDLRRGIITSGAAGNYFVTKGSESPQSPPQLPTEWRYFPIKWNCKVRIQRQGAREK